MITNGRHPINEPKTSAPGDHRRGHQGSVVYLGVTQGRPGPGQDIFFKPTLIMSLGLHLALIIFLVFGLPSCQREEERPPLDKNQVITVQILSDPSPPPADQPPREDLTPKPAPRPPAFELPLGDASRNLQRSGTPETETAEESVPPTPPEDLIALGPKAKAPPPELEKRQDRKPEVKPPKVARREESKPKPRPEADYSKVPQALYRTLGRDVGAMNFGSTRGRQVDPVVSRYFELALMKFNEHWAPPKGLSPKLVVGIALTIEPNGRISSVRMTRSSGLPEYDRSVERAIKMASPLSPLPPVFGGQRISQSFYFTPEGMGRRRR